MLKKQPNFRTDIAVLRFICITVVVFFHGYGMTYVHFSDDVNAAYSEIYEASNQYGPINVAMPMFIFISGFLFGVQLMHKQPVDFRKMVKSKFMRLMVPFFVFTVFFMLTTNSLSWKPFYQWTYWHLWFLPMLFWCFVATYFIRPLIFSDNSVVCLTTLSALLGFSVSGLEVPMILGVHNVHESIFWFAFGAWFYKHENIFSKRNLKIVVAICGGALYIMLFKLFPTEYGEQSILGSFTSLCGIASLWCLVGLFNWRDTMLTRILLSLSTASFGIYIFHNWIEMYMLSRTAQRLLPIEQLAEDHTVLFPLIFCIVAFSLSYICTSVLRLTKIGRKLI